MKIQVFHILPFVAWSIVSDNWQIFVHDTRYSQTLILRINWTVCNLLRSRICKFGPQLKYENLVSKGKQIM